jgi:hypothetical protein
MLLLLGAATATTTAPTIAIACTSFHGHEILLHLLCPLVEPFRDLSHFACGVIAEFLSVRQLAHLVYQRFVPFQVAIYPQSEAKEWRHRWCIITATNFKWPTTFLRPEYLQYSPEFRATVHCVA